MKTFLLTIIIGIILSGCDFDTSNIELGDINYEELSSETQSQIDGAGCEFSTERDGNLVFINGLMRINGVLELMQYVETNNGNSILYVNKNWEFQINFDESSEEDEGVISEGDATLKSRTSDDIKTFRAYGGCGC
jgi:hypothetical protein